MVERFGKNAYYGESLEERAKINSVLHWAGSTFYRYDFPLLTIVKGQLLRIVLTSFTFLKRLFRTKL